MQSINEEASSSTKRSRKLSVWKKSAKILFYGIIGSIVSELSVFSNRVITQEPFSFVEGVVYGIMAFILAGYFGWVNIEKHDERISAILPRSWRRMARTFRWYQFAFFEVIVEVPRIKVGKKQTVETLINEETLLFAKYLRNERREWNPRILCFEYCRAKNRLDATEVSI